MAELLELLNICSYCVYAPCVCGNEPENCANYVQHNGIKISKDGDTNGSA